MPSPIIRSLSARDADKDARASFNLSCLMIAPLPNGTFAIADRSQNFYLIVNELPPREEFALFHRLLNSSRITAEATFYGEPSDRDLASDLRRSAKAPRPKTSINLNNLL